MFWRLQEKKVATMIPPMLWFSVFWMTPIVGGQPAGDDHYRLLVNIVI